MENKPYRKLRWKIVATILSFSLIPLFILGFTIYSQFRVSYTAKIVEDLKALTNNTKNAIDLFLEDRIAQLTTLAYIHSFEKITQDGYLDQVFGVVKTQFRFFIDFGVIDDEGNHVAYSGPHKQLKGINYGNELWFSEVMGLSVFVSDVFLGFRKIPHFIISVARREGNRTWVLRATIDTEAFVRMVRAAWVGRGGDAYLINGVNLLQTTPRRGGRFLEQPAGPDLSAAVATSVEEIQYNGKTNLYAATMLAKKKWVLVVKEDPREAISPLFLARITGIFIFIFGVLVIVAGAVFVSLRMTERLSQVDREKAILDAGLIESSKMAALGKLAAGVAHEINNPLAVIKEKAGWMKDLLVDEEFQGKPIYEEFEESINRIDYHVERARKVIHRLLGFARRVAPVQEMVDVNQIVDETIDFLENEARFRNIDIQVNYDEKLPGIYSDSGQLQQVFLNIINNAIDSMEKVGGEINVETKFHPKEKEVTVSFADNGPGIPEELLPRIFEPFFTTKEQGSGTGLGLSISYGIIRKLGGRIVAASGKGMGATFKIYLPLKQ